MSLSYRFAILLWTPTHQVATHPTRYDTLEAAQTALPEILALHGGRFYRLLNIVREKATEGRS